MFIAGLVTLHADASISLFKKESSSRGRSGTKSYTLMKAERAFVKGDYEKVVEIGNKSGYSASRLDERLQYLAARALLKLKRYSEARTRFSKILNHGDDPRLLDKTYMGLADSYYLEGDYKQAKTHYEKAIRYFPDSDDLPVAYYRLGSCYAKLGNKASSKEYYDRLVRLYPESLEARLVAGRETDFVAYTVQVGSFAKWSNAKRLSDELNAKGFEANICPTSVGDTRYYRVRVGQYERLGDAEDMARNLKNRGYNTKIYP